MSTSSSAPARTPLSMQTEYARQQQFITFGMLLLLLGPLTLALAGVVAVIVKRNKTWAAIAAGVGALLLAGAGVFWQQYQSLAMDAWAVASAAYGASIAQQAGAPSPNYGALAQELWPLLWNWWLMSLPATPFAALSLLNNRVQSAEELEQERHRRAEQLAAKAEEEARQRLASSPESTGGAMVLGVPLGDGDLPWTANKLFTYPQDSMGRHGAVIGSSGMGKSETVLRLAAGARQIYGWKVFFVDCKGEAALQERFVATMRGAGAQTIGTFPQRPLNGWQGDGTALLNRLLAVVDYTEPYYKDLTKMLLNLALEAPAGPPRSSQELLQRMVLARLRQHYEDRPELDEIDGLKPKDAAASYNRYRAFFKALGSGLDGGADDPASWSFDTVDAGYILLDGLSLKDQTASFGRFIIEDFAHYAARRKPPAEKVLLIIDEYPVIAFSGAGTASLFEMVRFHGASIIVTGQSYAGMGEGFDRILGAAETLFLHRCGDPDRLLPRAGQRLGFKRRVGFAERGIGKGAREFATGDGFLSVDEELKIHPNDVKELPRGECFVIAGGRMERVLVKRVALPPPTPSPAPAAQTALAVEVTLPLSSASLVIEAEPTEAPSAEVAPAPDPVPAPADGPAATAVPPAPADATPETSPAASSAKDYRDEDDR